MKIFLLHDSKDTFCVLFIYPCNIDCDDVDYLEICVEHHDFLCGYEEINLRAWLGLALGCLETSTRDGGKEIVLIQRLNGNCN